MHTATSRLRARVKKTCKKTVDGGFAHDAERCAIVRDLRKE